MSWLAIVGLVVIVTALCMAIASTVPEQFAENLTYSGLAIMVFDRAINALEDGNQWRK